LILSEFMYHVTTPKTTGT